MIEKIQAKFSQGILGTHDFRGDLTVVVKKDSLTDLLRFLKTDPETDFNVLMDLSAVDYKTYGVPDTARASYATEEGPRFEVVYHLYSLAQNHRIRIKTPIEESNPNLPSVTGLWPAADWYEREVWDMFGLRFQGHPDLRRILMYEEFEGHPLRKDYPFNKRQPLIGPQN